MATAPPIRRPGRLEQLAVDRHRRDFANPGPFHYDHEAADRVLTFFRHYLRHTKGQWAGQPFEPADWQVQHLIRPLFGWKRQDGSRRFRIAWLELPRKSGKTTLAAGIGLYLLIADGEAGAEIYSAATTRDQAKIAWTQAKQMAEVMVKDHPTLNGVLATYQAAIAVTRTNSTFKPVSREAGHLDGLNAHGVILDEVHAHPTSEMWDVMTTATGARRQPLMIAITTAGVYSPESIGWKQHEHARQVLEGTVRDDAYFAYVAAADKDDDWKDPVTWAKANPGIDDTIGSDYLAEQCARAEAQPSFQNTFRRYHLNEWVQQAERWLDIGVWDACSADPPHDLAGRECYAGLDLASTRDLTALVLVFPDGDRFDVLTRFWVPGDNIGRRVHDDRVPYDAWSRDGHLIATDGNVFDDLSVFEEVMRLRESYNIREIAYDPWGATSLAPKLQAEGVDMVPFRQGFASMSGPTKELEKLVVSGRLRHGGHPVLRWMAGNVALTTDPAANVKVDKQRSHEKVDGIVALVMAIGRAMTTEADPVWPTFGAV